MHCVHLYAYSATESQTNWSLLLATSSIPQVVHGAASELPSAIAMLQWFPYPCYKKFQVQNQFIYSGFWHSNETTLVAIVGLSDHKDI